MSKILALAKDNQESHERIEHDSFERSSGSTPKSFEMPQEYSAVEMFRKEQA